MNKRVPVSLADIQLLGKWHGKLASKVTLTIMGDSVNDEMDVNAVITHILKQHYDISFTELKDAFPEKFI